MNYYGSPGHLDNLRDYEERVFPHCDFSKPSDEYSPGDGYRVLWYSAEDDKTQVRYLKDAVGTISSFTEAPEKLSF